MNTSLFYIDIQILLMIDAGPKMEADILVVDDNPDIVETLKAVFEAEDPNLTVRGAGSGMEALDIMREKPPDIVLLDILMPQMTGWDVASAMREDEGLKDIPIVYLTAKSDILSRDMGNLSGEDYVLKPFDSDDLIRRVKEVLFKTSYVKNQINLFK